MNILYPRHKGITKNSLSPSHLEKGEGLKSPVFSFRKIPAKTGIAFENIATPLFCIP
jgi:hypothetical protein